MLTLLWLAGGASVATVIGQVIVRVASIVVLIAGTVLGLRPNLQDAKPIWVILGAAIGLALLQLLPLSPALWQSLPGRAMLAEAASAAEQPQPWRSWAIVPGGAINAAASLIVPLTVLLLVNCIRSDERASLPGLLLAVIVSAMLVGLLQFSGADVTNPLVNAQRGVVDGLFANRNHFALFLAIGCVVAPVWAYDRDHAQRSPNALRARWRVLVAFALDVLFLLVILGGGSRAGVLLGVLGTGLGLLIVHRRIGHDLKHYSRWVFPAVITGVIATFAIFVLASVMAGRAVSIDRFMTFAVTQDLRARNLPVVLQMVWNYFPVGSGFGGFDTVYRIHEPLQSLQPEYFNHAHNDFVEVTLDGGLAALLLLIGALAWWARGSIRVWRSPAGGKAVPRMGSAVLALIFASSSVDYPARTPIIMAVTVIAAMCMSFQVTNRAPLPSSTKYL
jgi:O-antigen ligase